MTALKQTVTTLAHHVNNRLMAFSLELDRLEHSQAASGREDISGIVTSARRNIQEVSQVINALDRLEEIRTVPYVGTTEMIDIGAVDDDQ